MNRSQRALGFVASDFIRADPEIASMLALHVGATFSDCVTFDWLAFEGFAGGGPVLQRAAFKIKVEWLAVSADRRDAFRRGSKFRRNTNEQREAKEGTDAGRFIFH